MGKTWGWVGLAGLVATLGWTSSAQAQSAIEGVWRTVLESEVTIYSCPEGYCGHLTRIVVPTQNLSPEEAAAASSMSVEDFTDQRNKDPNLRNRPMLGLQILTLRAGGKPNIFDGEIYNPEDGNTYSGFLEMVGPDTVRLNGCVLFNTICRGEDWTRVPAEELQLRFEAEAAAAASGG